MSETNEDATEGGSNGPSESGEIAIGVLSKITNHLTRMSAGLDGKLLPNAEFQMAVRDPQDRAKLWNSLCWKFAPQGSTKRLGGHG